MSEQTPPAAAPKPADDRPEILIVGKDCSDNEMFAEIIKPRGLPVTIVPDGLSAWARLARTRTGLIILNPYKGPLAVAEFMTMIRNDSEFVKIPMIINGRRLTATELVIARAIGYVQWLTLDMKLDDIKKCIEQQYGKHFLLGALLSGSISVEQKVKNLCAGTNLLLKVSYNSMDFLRRLETYEPELLLIDLRYKNEAVTSILNIIHDDPEWSKIPMVSVMTAGNPVIKTAQPLGCTQNVDENMARSEAKRVIQLAVTKALFELPYPRLDSFDAGSEKKAA